MLDILSCPSCYSNFKLEVFKKEQNNHRVNQTRVRCSNYCYYPQAPIISQNAGRDIKCYDCYREEIIDGLLICEGCNKIFPIIDAIPRILPDVIREYPDFLLKYKEKLLNRVKNQEEKLPRMIEKTKNAFAYEWLNKKLGFTSKAETLIGFFAKTGIDPNLYQMDFSGYESDRPAEQIRYEPNDSFLRDKLILDVGCGMGRYMNIANMFKCEVVGFDLSAAVEKAKKDTMHNPFSHVIQANILYPPFKKNSFDFIYSIGVLHHTPDTKKSFKCVTPLLKTGGVFSLCVYEKSNYPLRDTVERLIRKITTKLPLKLLFYLSYIGVPLGWLQKRLRKNRLTFILCAPLFIFKVCEHWDRRIRHTDTFDFYVAPYQWRHTHKEVLKWFEEENFEDIQILPENPICIKGVKEKE